MDERPSPSGSRAAPAAISALLAAALAAGFAGCGAPKASGLRFVSAKARRDAGIYSVTAVVENGSPAVVSHDSLEVDMTTYDAAGKEIARDYAFTFRGMRGCLAPAATTRLPLNRPDRDRRVRASRLYLRDDRGRTLSEIDVPPESAVEDAAGAAPRPALDTEGGAPAGSPFPILSGGR